MIAGARCSLPDLVGIQLEIAVVPLYDNQLLLVETLQFMAEHGFTPALLYPNNFDRLDTVRLIEVDCVFSNDHFRG